MLPQLIVELGTKITGNITETCCWCRSCYKRSATLLETYFVFKQDNAPAHRACDTVEILRCETPQFISLDVWPAKSPDISLVDYHIWDTLQERIYQSAIRTSFRGVLLRHGLNFSIACWTIQLIGGEKDWKRASGAEGGHFEHLSRCCLPAIPVTTRHNRFSFHSHQRLEERNSQMKMFCILQGSVMTFFRCGG